LTPSRLSSVSGTPRTGSMPEELEWKTRKERVDRKLKSLHPA
jgi:hypothetical protein